jgi:hypothetical protein
MFAVMVAPRAPVGQPVCPPRRSCLILCPAARSIFPARLRCGPFYRKRKTPVTEELSRILKSGEETIVRDWAERVASDRRVYSDSRLTYLQLVDHIPQIVEELRRSLALGSEGGFAAAPGSEHGRQRWRQGYELKEVVRELTLLRATLFEFLDRYRGALPRQSPEELSHTFQRINRFLDDEIYKTVEAYLEAPRTVPTTDLPAHIGNF